MDAAIERLVAAMDSSETDASLEQVMARRRGDISPLDVVIRKAAGYTFVLSVVGRNVLLPLVHTSSSAVTIARKSMSSSAVRFAGSKTFLSTSCTGSRKSVPEHSYSATP